MYGITISSDNVSFPTLLGSRAFVLDCWRVYPTRNLIQHRQHDDDSRQLEPRLMRLLCLLAASADGVVTREDIIETLWPRVVVNENSLTRAISDLRRALTPAGDKRSTLIQTIPKRGYRLTRAPEAVVAAEGIRPQAESMPPPAIRKHWLARWTPSIAAGFILALALVVRVGENVVDLPAVAQLPDTDIGPRQASQALVDRVIDDNELIAGLAGEASALPTSLSDHAPTFPITRLGYAADDALPAWHMAPDVDEEQRNIISQGQSMLTPDGQLLVYVEYQGGISSLNLRPAMTDAEPWTAFTTDERILRLQWSPLDAGILMTVGNTADLKDRGAYLRLMLLDLESLTVQELYRRELPAEGWASDIGNLT